MYCKKCNNEITDNNAKVCPACGAKITRDKFPTWVVVLLVLLCCGFFILPIIGIIAAITIPTLLINTNTVKNKTILKKTYVTLNQSMLMDIAISDKKYSNFEDVWNKSIKNNLLISKDIENGVVLKDMTEIKYEKLKNKCNSIHDEKEISDRTACAVLVIDTDGFDKGQNRHSMHTGIHDQFKLMLYSDAVAPVPNTIEYEILNNTEDKKD